ncbi:MAG: hypothetical protein V7647_3014 [Acidobacteriota bacterium]|jgi:hypothetical protein
MTSHHADDTVANSLRRLSRLTPDSDRAERVRQQCRTRLERRWRPESAVTSHDSSWQMLTPVVVGGVCLIYALALVVTTLRLEGVF